MMGWRSNGPGTAVAQAYVGDVRDEVGPRARSDICLEEKVRKRVYRVFVGPADVDGSEPQQGQDRDRRHSPGGDRSSHGAHGAQKPRRAR